jgi:hypothetical protein
MNPRYKEIKDYPVVDLPITLLKSSKKNPRSITQKNLKKLADKIKKEPEFLKINPVKYFIEEGEYKILCGDKRTAACRMLGFKTVPAIDTTNLTPAQRDKLMLIDNIHEGNFENDMVFEFFDEETIDFAGGGFDIAGAGEQTDKEPEEIEVVPYSKTHVLLSFHPDLAPEVMKIIDKITRISGVEIEQSSN